MRHMWVLLALASCGQTDQVAGVDAMPTPRDARVQTPSPDLVECVVNKRTTVFGDGSSTTVETHFALFDGLAFLEEWTVELCGFVAPQRTCPNGAFCSESGPTVPEVDCRFVHRVGDFTADGKLLIHCGIKVTTATPAGVETVTTPYTGPATVRVHHL